MQQVLSHTARNELSSRYLFHSILKEDEGKSIQNSKVLFYKEKYNSNRGNILLDMLSKIINDSTKELAYFDNDWIIVVNYPDEEYWDNLFETLSDDSPLRDMISCINVTEYQDLYYRDVGFSEDMPNYIFDINDEIFLETYIEFFNEITIDKTELIFMFNENTTKYYDSIRFYFNHLEFITLNPTIIDSKSIYEYVDDKFNICTLEFPFENMEANKNFIYHSPSIRTKNNVLANIFNIKLFRERNDNNKQLFKTNNINIFCNEKTRNDLITDKIKLYSEIINNNDNVKVKTHYKALRTNIIADRYKYIVESKSDKLEALCNVITDLYKVVEFNKLTSYVDHYLFNAELSLWNSVIKSERLVINEFTDISAKLYENVDIVFITSISSKSLSLINNLLSANPKIKIVILINQESIIDNKFIKTINLNFNNIKNYGRKSFINLFG